MAKEKSGFLRERKDGGDKYRIKHELITHYKLRSVQGLVTMKAGPHHRTSASGGTTTGGSSPAVGLQSASPPGQGLEREEEGAAHPGGLQGPSGADCTAFACCPHHLPPYRSKNNFSLVHDFERL